jgi:hypothetical protein
MALHGCPMRLVSAAALLSAGLLASGTLQAQPDGFDAEEFALAFHRVTGEPMDTQSIASRSRAALASSAFDRPEVIAGEKAQLDARLASMDPSRAFTVTIDDRITEYDHDAGQFSIELFTPGYYVPVQAYGQEYRVVFANAASARAIPMERDAAREFDARLTRSGRQISNEIRFRVIGKGDPVGAVAGPLVVRAEMLSVRVLDQSGQLVVTPRIAAVDGGSPFAGFDASAADVAGLRIGVHRSDMEATLSRLFGAVSPGVLSLRSGGFTGFTGTIQVNGMGCRSLVGQRKSPGPGAVCVTAYYDADEVVRMVRIERLFPPDFNGEVFRKALVLKYGPATGGRSRTSWGPGVPGAVLNAPDTVVDALTAAVTSDRDITSIGSNRRENFIVSLQLIDAAWAAQFGR